MVARWRFLQKVVPFLGGHSWSFCRFWSTHLRWSWKRRMIREGHGEHRPQKFWRKYSKKKSGKQWVLVRGLLHESSNNNNNNLGLACVFLPFSYQCPPTFRFFSVRSEASVHGGAVERIVIQVTSRFTALRGWILAKKIQKKKTRKFENIKFHRQNMSKWTNKKIVSKVLELVEQYYAQPIDSMILLLRST